MGLFDKIFRPQPSLAHSVVASMKPSLRAAQSMPKQSTPQS